MQNRDHFPQDLAFVLKNQSIHYSLFSLEAILDLTYVLLICHVMTQLITLLCSQHVHDFVIVHTK
jgi:hypothetical protein